MGGDLLNEEQDQVARRQVNEATSWANRINQQPQHHHRNTRENSSSRLQTATTLNFPASTQSPVSKLSGRYGTNLDMNNCIRQVPLCQMTMNMILMFMRTHMRMDDGTNCTKTTMILVTMKTVMRPMPLKCQIRMTLLPFWIYPQLSRRWGHHG